MHVHDGRVPVDASHRSVSVKGCGKKKFLVDVFHTYVYSVAVEAEDAAEAYDLARDA